MNDDLKELLKLFNSRGIEYVIIGAHALAFYGHPRFTEDLDLWLSQSKETAKHLSDALKEFGIPMESGGEEAWVQERQMIRMGLPPNRVDLLNFGADIPFEEIWSRRVSSVLEGVPVQYISKADFIRSKQDAGRPKDLLDLQELSEFQPYLDK
ncbi:nucleotidyl transferase AbiEii/AbiGii toxin family protein [soil metagenome]